MSEVKFRISCPHCRRTYDMAVDLSRLRRVRPRATCKRCGEAFDVVARIRAMRSAAKSSEASGRRASMQRMPAVTQSDADDILSSAELDELLVSLPPRAPKPPPVPVEAHGAQDEAPSPNGSPSVPVPAGSEAPPRSAHPSRPAAARLSGAPVPMRDSMPVPGEAGLLTENSDEIEQLEPEIPRDWLSESEPGLAGLSAPGDRGDDLAWLLDHKG